MLKEIKIEADPSFKNTLDLDALLSPTIDYTLPPRATVSPRGLQRSLTDKQNIDISIEDLKFDPRTTYIIHTVDPKDTLQGLALRYCVSVQEIKKENKIYNPTAIYSQKQLIIPVRRTELQQRLRSRTNEKQEIEKEKQETIKHFIQITNSTEAEALQYLKLTQFNLELAIEKHQLGNMTMPKKKTPFILLATDQKHIRRMEVLLNRVLYYKILIIIRTIAHSLILLKACLPRDQEKRMASLILFNISNDICKWRDTLLTEIR